MFLAFLINFALAAEPFRVCLEPNNLPMSHSSPPRGFEVEAARVLADELHRPFIPVWVSQRDHSYFKQTLGRGVCDAVMGAPKDFARLETTKSWYRSGFMFVAQEKLTGFDDPRLKQMTVGVPATGLGETPPALEMTRRGLSAQLRPFSIYEPARMIQAVNKNEIDAAVAWGPFAGWFGQNLQQTFAAPFAMEISVGVRKGNISLRDQLNQALAKRHQDLLNILNKWRVPLRGDS